MPKICALVLKYFLLLFTWTYNGPLKYYTLEPIESIAIASHQRDEITIRALLAEFRRRKEQELHFVQRAVRILANPYINNRGAFSLTFCFAGDSLCSCGNWREVLV